MTSTKKRFESVISVFAGCSAVGKHQTFSFSWRIWVWLWKQGLQSALWQLHWTFLHLRWFITSLKTSIDSDLLLRSDGCQRGNTVRLCFCLLQEHFIWLCSYMLYGYHIHEQAYSQTAFNVQCVWGGSWYISWLSKKLSPVILSQMQIFQISWNVVLLHFKVTLRSAERWNWK